MEKTDPPQCVIDPNPDIIGVGVRVSLYVLSLAGPVLSNIIGSAEFTKAIDSSLGLNGLALFLTAVISTANGTIALFHAICIFHMLALAGITINPKGRYPIGQIRFWAFTAFYLVAMAGSLSYFIYVFATAPTFGNQPECNSHTLYVLFGYNISATNVVMRWIFVASFAILLVGFVFYLLIATGVACSSALDCPLIELVALLLGKVDGGADAQRAIELRREADVLDGRRITEV
ncbi:hypothetical protein DL767_010437 [Monosporascus sp. MG133]|nr:hypothetical protein DL767_010437 [Monosporascus sp. MG133]